MHTNRLSSDVRREYRADFRVAGLLPSSARAPPSHATPRHDLYIPFYEPFRSSTIMDIAKRLARDVEMNGHSLTSTGNDHTREGAQLALSQIRSGSTMTGERKLMPIVRDRNWLEDRTKG